MKMKAAYAWVGIAATCAALAGCSYMAVRMAPDKMPVQVRSELAERADGLFWDAFHAGRYADISRVLDVETAAYLKTPGDARTAAHIGWLHIWRLAESARTDTVTATITDDAVMAKKYFQEAVALDPTDARYLGFLASAEVAEGSIHHDEKLTRTGYYRLLESIDAWPEFNLFTAGYMMSNQPSSSPRYKEALEWQWRTLDLCAGTRVSRTEPTFEPYMDKATTVGAKRVCWNSWIAPHNFEGFFMNMGDMLVKSGDWVTGQKIYANAALSPTYAAWPFKALLEQRIREARGNVELLRVAPPAGPTRMMNSSAVACVACHQGVAARAGTGAEAGFGKLRLAAR